MTIRAILRSSSRALFVGLFAFTLSAVWQAPPAFAADAPAAAPSHQVIACYFHRTVRCPTCKKIGGYVEESVKTGFASQVKDNSVKMMFMDFQDQKNQKYTEAYKITGPTLVIMDVRDGKVASWKAAPKVWSLVSNKDDFFKYVQGEVKSYLDSKEDTKHEAKQENKKTAAK